jgi:hypothetical protein
MPLAEDAKERERERKRARERERERKIQDKAWEYSGACLCWAPLKVRASFRLDRKDNGRQNTRVHWKLTGCGSCSFAGSRYIYDLYYEKEAISKKLYEWLLKNNYADAMLIAKWKKQGYEKVSAVAAFPFFYNCAPVLTGNFFSTAVLLAMHPDQGDQLQQHMHLPRAQRTAEAGPRDRVRQLWVPGLL